MCAEIDWNSVWIERQKCSIASGRGGGCSQAWQEKAAAEKYLQRAMNGYAAQERLRDLLASVKPGGRVLDVGAGPGNLAIPLSKVASHVTAVEPAAGMAAVFQDQIRDQAIENIHLVHKKWDDVDERLDLRPPYDLTFASYSLGMVDLRAALEKMIAVTTHEIVIYWHAGDQAWDREALFLWPALHHKEHYPIPKSDLVFNVLYQMGIYPEVRVLRSETKHTYPSFEDAVVEFAQRFEIQTESQYQLLREYLVGELVEEDGCVVQKYQHTGMKISWTVSK